MLQTAALAMSLLAATVLPMSVNDGQITINFNPEGEQTQGFYPSGDVALAPFSWFSIPYPEYYEKLVSDWKFPVVGDTLNTNVFFTPLAVQDSSLSSSSGIGYYVYQIPYGMDLQDTFHFDVSNLPSWTDGVGWSPSFSGVTKDKMYAVMPIYYYEGKIQISSDPAVLCIYLELGFGRTGYYPLRNWEGGIYTIQSTAFLSRFNGQESYTDYGDIGYLASLGQSLLDKVANFRDVLGLKVLGQDFLSILVGPAFLVFAGWIVFKFVVGL